MTNKEKVEMEPTGKDKSETKKRRHRSPNYPAVGLRDAVDRVKLFYEADGKAGAPSEIAATHIGFSKAHGQAMSVLSALKKFGLIKEGVGGRVAPTQQAIEILNLPSDDPRRVKALQDAAKSPEIYEELLKEYSKGLPASDTMERELVTYKSFNPKAVTAFVRDFRDTLEFAGISDLSALNWSYDEKETGMQTETDSPKSQPKSSGGFEVFQMKQPLQNTSFAVPVEFSSADQRVVMAHISFDAPLKKEYLARLRGLLKAMEDGLDSTSK